jgi:hypothetical protein
MGNHYTRSSQELAAGAQSDARQTVRNIEIKSGIPSQTVKDGIVLEHRLSQE